MPTSLPLALLALALLSAPAGERLTADLLNKVILGARAANRVLLDRDRTAAARDQKRAELTRVSAANADVRTAYTSANSKRIACRTTSFRSLDQERMERVQEKMASLQADPGFFGRVQALMTKHAKAMGDAQQQQDQVAMQKVQTDMMMEMSGVDIRAELRADTVRADAACGKLPPMSPPLRREEKLRREIAAAGLGIRALEATAATRGTRASGLEMVRFLELRQRAMSIMDQLNGKSGNVRYDDAEVALVSARRRDLQAVRRAP